MEIYELVEKIDNLRKERGWTNYKLCEEAGITQSTLFNMHSRGTLPSITTLYAICNAFGITLSEFFSDGQSYAPDKSEMRLVEKYRKLSYRDKKAVNAVIDALGKD